MTRSPIELFWTAKNVIISKVNSIYGDVSREGLLATGALLLGAGGDHCPHVKRVMIEIIYDHLYQDNPIHDSHRTKIKMATKEPLYASSYCQIARYCMI